MWDLNFFKTRKSTVVLLNVVLTRTDKKKVEFPIRAFIVLN